MRDVLRILILVVLCSLPGISQEATPGTAPDPGVYSESRPYSPRQESEKDAKNTKRKPQPAIDGAGHNGSALTLAVAVYDKKGRPVAGLEKKDISVLIDGNNAEITSVRAGMEPLDLILLLDASPSGDARLKATKELAQNIVSQLGPDDRVTVVGIGDKVKIGLERSQDRPHAIKAIEKIRTTAGTSFYDAVTKVSEMSRDLLHPATVVLVTDGVDTTSRHSYSESLAEAERGNLVVSVFYLDTIQDMSAKVLPPLAGLFPKTLNSKAEYERGVNYLNDLLALSGGRKWDAKAVSNIVADMRSRYYVTFRFPPTDSHDERHDIRIRVYRSGMQVLSKASTID